MATSVIISADVTNPAVKPFIVADHLQTNADGSVTPVLANGTFAGQEPNVYGKRNDNTTLGVYQKATRSGALITFFTRPGDTPMTYSIIEAQTF